MSLLDTPVSPRYTGAPLDATAIAPLLAQLPRWSVVDDHHLFRQFDFPDFKAGLAFVNAVGALAEAVNHHPDLLLAWGKVQVTLFTHAIGGLCAADFALAARIDGAYGAASAGGAPDGVAQE